MRAARLEIRVEEGIYTKLYIIIADGWRKFYEKIINVHESVLIKGMNCINSKNEILFVFEGFIYCFICIKQGNPNLLEELELLTISVAIDTDIAKDAKLYSCLGCITSEGDYAGIQSFVLYSETVKVTFN